MRSILVPLDGSSLAEQAIPVAANVARRTGANLEFVAVHQPTPAALLEEGSLTFDWRFDSDLKRELGEYLQRIEAATLSAEHGISLGTALLEGSVAETIVAYAHQTGADLIVLTTHGLSGPSRTWLGSVSDALVRNAGLPVLAVRPRAGAAAASFTMRRVLLALDGTGWSESAIGPATALGNDSVEYVLLRVTQPLHPLLRAVTPDRVYEHDASAQRRYAEEYLAGVTKRLSDRGMKVRWEVREDLSPGRAIVDAATDLGADVIVLATHGRGPLGRVLLGSVADKVLRGAVTPVLLHHPITGPIPLERIESSMTAALTTT